MGYFLIFLLVIVFVYFIAILLGTFLPSKMATDYLSLFKSKDKPENRD